jgi:hypothetical protein
MLAKRDDLEGALQAYQRADNRGDAAGALLAADLYLWRKGPVLAEGAYQRAYDRATADYDADIREKATAGLAKLRRGPARVWQRRTHNTRSD